MKTKRLTERELRVIAHEVPQGRRSWDPYYQAVLECLAYRRALRGASKVLARHPHCMTALETAALRIIERALGAKR